jgi:hypothetical protein
VLLLSLYLPTSRVLTRFFLGAVFALDFFLGLISKEDDATSGDESRVSDVAAALAAIFLLDGIFEM